MYAMEDRIIYSHPNRFPANKNGQPNGSRAFWSEGNVIRSVALINSLVLQCASPKVRVLEFHLQVQTAVAELLIIPITGD